MCVCVCAIQIESIQAFLQDNSPWELHPALVTATSPKIQAVKPSAQPANLSISDLQKLRSSLTSVSSIDQIASGDSLLLEKRNKKDEQDQSISQSLFKAIQQVVAYTDFIANSRTVKTWQNLPIKGSCVTRASNGQTEKALQDIFPAMMTQSVTNAILGAAHILKAALKEDETGTIIHSVPAILSALLSLDMTLSSYEQLLHRTFSTKINSLGRIQQVHYKLKSNQHIPPEVQSIIAANKQAIEVIVKAYRDFLQTCILPTDVQPLLATYLYEPATLKSVE